MDLRELLQTFSKEADYQQMVELASEDELVKLWKEFCEEADKEINREIVRTICNKAVDKS